MHSVGCIDLLPCIFRESSPGTPSFGAQGSLSRDGSFKEYPLFKDGSLTTSLQAAFQSHLEDVAEQSEAEQAEVSALPMHHSLADSTLRDWEHRCVAGCKQLCSMLK